MREAFKQADRNYPWAKTISDLRQELKNSAGLCIKFDTVIINDSMSAIGNAVTTIHIEARFAHILVFSAQPYANAVAGNPVLSAFTPWYTAGIIRQFYKNKNKRLSNQDWNKAFGPQGYMKRVCSSLLIADSVYVRFEITQKEYPDLQDSTVNPTAVSIHPGIHEISTSEMYGPPALLGVIVSGIGDFTD